MKILNTEVKTTEYGWVNRENGRYIIVAKGKRYEINRIIGDSPVLEAWGLFDGNYYLVSVGDIELITVEKAA